MTLIDHETAKEMLEAIRSIYTLNPTTLRSAFTAFLTYVPKHNNTLSKIYYDLENQAYRIREVDDTLLPESTVVVIFLIAVQKMELNPMVSSTIMDIRSQLLEYNITTAFFALKTSIKLYPVSRKPTDYVKNQGQKQKNTQTGRQSESQSKRRDRATVT